MVARRRRRNRRDFFRAGLDVLADDGPRAVNAARLARELGVTTGSFYWHFASVPRFHEELQRYWRDEIVVGLVREARRRAEAPENLLEELGKLIVRGRTYRIDAAMRSWARTDEGARRAVERADAWRSGFLKETLASSGLQDEHARDRASLMGAFWMGSREMDPDQRFKLLRLAASGD